MPHCLRTRACRCGNKGCVNNKDYTHWKKLREHEIWKAAYAAATPEERMCCEEYTSRSYKRINYVHWGKCTGCPAEVPTLDEYLAMRDGPEKDGDGALLANGPRRSPTLSESYNDLSLSSKEEELWSDDAAPPIAPPAKDATPHFVPLTKLVEHLELPAAFTTKDITATQPATQVAPPRSHRSSEDFHLLKYLLRKSVRLATKKRNKVNRLKTAIQRLDKKCEALRGRLKQIDGYSKAL